VFGGGEGEGRGEREGGERGGGGVVSGGCSDRENWRRM